MHDNTYIVAREANKVLGTIVSCVKERRDPQGNEIKGWYVTEYVDEVPVPEMPHSAVFLNTENGEEKRTYVLIQAYEKNTKADEEGEETKRSSNFLCVSPHFQPQYAYYNDCPNQELENLLKRFDTMLEYHFAGLYERAVYIGLV